MREAKVVCDELIPIAERSVGMSFEEMEKNSLILQLASPELHKLLYKGSLFLKPLAGSMGWGVQLHSL